MNFKKINSARKWLILIIGFLVVAYIFIFIYGTKLSGRTAHEHAGAEIGELSLAEIDLIEKEFGMDFCNNQVHVAKFTNGEGLKIQIDSIDNITAFLTAGMNSVGCKCSAEDTEQILSYLRGDVAYDKLPQSVLNDKQIFVYLGSTDKSDYPSADLYDKFTNADFYPRDLDDNSFLKAVRLTEIKDTAKLQIIIFNNGSSYGAVLKKRYIADETLKNVFLKNERLN